MSDNFKNQSWINDLRTIDTYVETTPSIVVEDKVKNILIAKGGFNNASYQYKIDTGSTDIMFTVGQTLNVEGSQSLKYSLNGGDDFIDSNIVIPSGYMLKKIKLIKTMNTIVAILVNSTDESVKATKSKVYTSYDGISWDEGQEFNYGFNDIAYYESKTALNTYNVCMVGNYGAVALSQDCQQWKVSTVSDYEGDLSSYNFLYVEPYYTKNYDNRMDLKFVLVNDRKSYRISSLLILDNPEIDDGVLYGNITIKSRPTYTGIDNYSYSAVNSVFYNGDYYLFMAEQYINTNGSYSARLIVAKNLETFSNFGISSSGYQYLTSDCDMKISENTAIFVSEALNYVVYSKDFGNSWSNSVNIPYYNAQNNIYFSKIGFQNDKIYVFAHNKGFTYTKDFRSWSDFTNYRLNDYFTSIKDFTYHNLMEYNLTKKYGFFDSQNASFQLGVDGLNWKNVEYASEYVSDEEGRIGYVSDDGSITYDPVRIGIITNSRRARYLEIVGDISRCEYPEAFTLTQFANSMQREPEYYTGNVLSVVVSNNNLVHCIIDFGEYIEMPPVLYLNITKWSTPNTCVKLNYIGFDIKYAFTSQNILKNYSLDQVLKNEGNFGYGLKYTGADMTIYNDEFSTGSVAVTVSEYQDGEWFNERTFRVRPINIVQLLDDCQENSLFKFYVKTSSESEYHLIGKYYSDRINYNSQSDELIIYMYDILKNLQNIPAQNYNWIKNYMGEEMSNAQFTSILNTIKQDLKTYYGITFDYDSNILSGYIDKVVTNSSTIWGLLDELCALGMFYVYANHTDENVDVSILYRR